MGWSGGGGGTPGGTTGQIQYNNSGVFGGSSILVSGNNLQLGGATSSFPMMKQNAAAINFRLADDSADASISALNVNASNNIICTNNVQANGFLWGTASGAAFILGSGADLWLQRDAADILAQRDGSNPTNAQASRVYNTYTDVSNGEWWAIDWKTTANLAIVGPAANGTGTVRAMSLRRVDSATGAGTAVTSTANCPAVTPGAIFTWLKMTSSDGSTVYVPSWK